MKRKYLWIVIGLVTVVVVLLALKKAGVIGKEEGTKVTSEKVEKRTIIQSVTATGKVYPEVEVKVSSDISGEIVDLMVQEGDSVRKGQILANIYADILISNRNRAEAIVNQQSASVTGNQASLAAAKARLDQAKITYDRQKKLLEDKVISKAEFEQADNTYRTSQADYNGILESIKGSQAAVASAQASLNEANKNLSRTTIMAPMSGVVSLMSVKKGERVVGTAQMAGTEMMRIADLSKIEVRVDVGENDIVKINLGDSALVEVDAYNNRNFKGIVTQIANTSSSVASSASGAAGVSEVSNYRVHIRLLPSSYEDLIDPTKPKRFPFRPGMSASADIQTTTILNALSVPINAVTTRDKNDKAKSDKKQSDTEEESSGPVEEMEVVVFVLQADQKVKKVKVQSGIQDINYIQILDGLNEGDEVISGPYSVVSKTLKDGSKVKVTSKDKVFDNKK